jgi:hypothetical protein
MFRTVKEKGVWRISTNQELKNIYIEPDVISKIRKERLGWLGLMERISEERVVKRCLRITRKDKKVYWKAEIKMVRRC